MLLLVTHGPKCMYWVQRLGGHSDSESTVVACKPKQNAVGDWEVKSALGFSYRELGSKGEEESAKGILRQKKLFLRWERFCHVYVVR